MKERVLVIRLGALGDLVLCMGGFAAIRAHYPDAEIALLTGPSFAGFGLQMPWFDRVLIDPRPKMTEPLKWIKLIRDVRSFAPTRVYDFQGKTRQSILFHALGKPAWSGAAKGCSHPRLWPPVEGMHFTDFLATQLEKAGIGAVAQPDLAWLDDPLTGFEVPQRFALLIAGCSPQHPHKRWPPEYYADLAQKLAGKGIASLAVGTQEDAFVVASIRALAPEVIDITGKTSLKQLAALARRAELVVGNDTGPTHLAAAVGARTVALMSEKVNPIWSAPKGPQASWVQGKPLMSLSVEAVVKEAGMSDEALTAG